MPIAFLLAMQAAGMVVDYFGKSEQVRLMQMGEKIQEAGINANIETSRLQTEEESLNSMTQLRQNLGTQAAFQAARGGSFGTTATVLPVNASVGNFNANDRLRRLNELGTENAYNAQKLIGRLHETAGEEDIWNEFRKNVFNKIPGASAFGGMSGAGGSGVSGGAHSLGGSFGMTNIGAY